MFTLYQLLNNFIDKLNPHKKTLVIRLYRLQLSDLSDVMTNIVGEILKQEHICFEQVN